MSNTASVNVQSEVEFSAEKIRSLAFFSSAMSYQNRGLTDAALESFSKAIELNPDESILYLVRGRVYNNQGLFQEAINDFSHGIKLSPDEALFYLSRAIVYEESGLLEEATKDYDQFACLDH